MHPAGIAILIVTTWVTVSVPLGLLVGRFIRAGQAGGPPVVAPPPEPTPHEHHPDASAGTDGVVTPEPVGATPSPAPTTGPRSMPSLRSPQPGRLLIRRVRTVTGLAGHRRPGGHTPTTPPTTTGHDRSHAAD